MILAGDVGGTKTLLALFERERGRPRPVTLRSFATTQFSDLGTMIADFLAAERVDRSAIEAAAFGVAGPVLDGRARLTNVGWAIAAAEVRERFSFPKVELLNDLEAMAWSISVLQPAEMDTLQAGAPDAAGTRALIAAGTGLGMATLVCARDSWLPVASEGGHADFAARTPREVQLLEALTKWHGRAQWEDIVSGPGLVNLHRFTHRAPCPAVPAELDAAERPAAISIAALEERCADCVEALGIFTSVYGSAAGNLALIAGATGGVYVGGGIAPKILPALRDGRFMTSFLSKAPMDGLLARIPVRVILNSEAGLLGAAVRVNQ